MRWTHEYTGAIITNLYKHGILAVICEFTGNYNKQLAMMMCVEYKSHRVALAIGDDKMVQLGQELKEAEYDFDRMENGRLFFENCHLDMVRKALEFCAFNFLQMYDKVDELDLSGFTEEEIMKQLDAITTQDGIYMRKVSMLDKRKKGRAYKPKVKSGGKIGDL